jgi:hypothetical protein
MDWILRRVLSEGFCNETPPELEDAVEAFLEDAGIALVGTGASFDLLDSLGRDADSLAARALAELN